MDLLAQFVIPFICLRIAVGNLLALWRPARRLESELSKELEKGQTERQQPDSAELPSASTSESETRRRLRSIRWKAGVWLTTGCLGLWASGFDLGWEWGRAPEWRGKNSPRLEGIVRDHCAPFIEQGGGS